MMENTTQPTIEEVQQQLQEALAKIAALTPKKRTLSDFMSSIFGASWRTALGGWASGATVFLWAGIDAYNSGAFTGKHGFALVLGVLSIIKGATAKDAKVTGLPGDNKPTTNVPTA